MPNGQGTWTSLEGEKYVGNWKMGKRNGNGTCNWPDGESYAGDWVKKKIEI